MAELSHEVCYMCAKSLYPCQRGYWGPTILWVCTAECRKSACAFAALEGVTVNDYEFAVRPDAVWILVYSDSGLPC